MAANHVEKKRVQRIHDLESRLAGRHRQQQAQLLHHRRGCVLVALQKWANKRTHCQTVRVQKMRRSVEGGGGGLRANLLGAVATKGNVSTTTTPANAATTHSSAWRATNMLTSLSRLWIA